MSNIVLVLREKSVDVSVLKELHKLLGGSLAKIRTAISNNQPIVEMEIFDSQYQEKSGLLRKLITLIRERDVGVDVYELPDGDTFEESGVLKKSSITIDILENILNFSDEEMNRQLDM